LPLNASCDVVAALGDGEDYELLVVAKERAIIENWPFDLALTAIGQMKEPSIKLMPGEGGWDHFSEE